MLLQAIGINSFSQTVKAKEVPVFKKSLATVPYTESVILHSKLFDQDFEIMVHLPTTYHPDSSRVFPVMYVTDANRSFPMIANISFLLGFPRTDFPEVIVVGVGYKIRGLEDWSAWRTRDLTPTNVPTTDKNTREMLSRLSGREMTVNSGGAEKFLNFIVSELIPFIESGYHVSRTDRTLAGYSYGGLFCLYALFKHPELFNKADIPNKTKDMFIKVTGTDDYFNSLFSPNDFSYISLCSRGIEQFKIIRNKYLLY